MLSQVIPPELIAHRKASQGEDYIELWNSSRIHFIGLDNPYRWYSAEIGYLFFDEAQEIEEESVLRLMNRLRQPGMPHRIIVTFNPANPGHWLQNWFLNAAVPTDFGIPGVKGSHKNVLTFSDEPDAESMGEVDFVFAKATDNPYLPAEYIRQLKAQPPHMRRRYFDGLWEYHDESCFFDGPALEYYEQLARETDPALVGVLVGDIEADIAYRLKRTRERSKDPIRIRKDPKGNLIIWKTPVRGNVETRPHRYVVAVDASSGRGADYTALQVLDVETFEQAAEMQVKLPPEQIAEIAYRLGRIYNDALIVCEITGGWGFAVDEKLRRELKYPRPYTRSAMDRLSKKWTDKVGFDTNKRTRPLLLSALEEALRERELGMYSSRCHAELASFVIGDNGRGEARQGAHDDLVLALAMAVYICQQQPKQLRQLKPDPPRPQFAATGY
jgi:phage terminase large subunit